jgi:TPR repeat protein
MYSRGWGVPVNEAEAVKWYRLAANREQPVAQNNLGVMYMSGKGGPKDVVLGLMWLMLAAENGHENANKAIDVSKQDVTPRELDLAREFTVLYRKKWAIARKE